MKYTVYVNMAISIDTEADTELDAGKLGLDMLANRLGVHKNCLSIDRVELKKMANEIMGVENE